MTDVDELKSKRECFFKTFPETQSIANPYTPILIPTYHNTTNRTPTYRFKPDKTRPYPGPLHLTIPSQSITFVAETAPYRTEAHITTPRHTKPLPLRISPNLLFLWARRPLTDPNSTVPNTSRIYHT